MIHRCSQCHQRYLISDYYALCDYCGQVRQQQIEQLHETDGAVEWWRWCSRMMHGISSEYKPRWRIG